MAFSFISESCLVEQGLLCATPGQEAVPKDQETQVSGDPGMFSPLNFGKRLSTETSAEAFQPGGSLSRNCVRRERKRSIL